MSKKFKSPKVIIENIFRYHGYLCVVIIHVGGGLACRNGYVAVPNYHKYFKDLQIEDPKISCHGGLTYVEYQNKYPITTRKPLLWIGMDCLHWKDCAIKELSNALLLEGSSHYFEEGIVRSQKFVESQCKYIVKQLE